MRRLDGITNLIDKNLSKLWEAAQDSAVVHGAAKSQHDSATGPQYHVS